MALSKPSDIIFDYTDGGLTIIERYYPDIRKVLKSTSKKFSQRDEGDPSTAIRYNNKFNKYEITDFGDDSRARDAISLVMHKEHIDNYREAIRYCFKEFQIPSEGKVSMPDNVVVFRNRTDKETPGKNTWKVKKKWSEADIKCMYARHVIEYYQHVYSDKWMDKLQDVCKRYDCYALEYYAHVRTEEKLIELRANSKPGDKPPAEVIQTVSNDNFPVYLFVFKPQGQGKEYYKILKPRARDKAYRFEYSGDKPQNHIGGYTQIVKAYDDLVEDKKKKEAKKKKPDHDADAKAKDTIEDPADNHKLDWVIELSGERDAMNAAALGYYPFWLNSESVTLGPIEYNGLATKAKKIGKIPDLDASGFASAHRACMQYNRMYWVQLPADLRQFKDWRGNPCKDALDYLNYYKKEDFDKLIKNSLNYDLIESFDTKFTGTKYQYDLDKVYFFLTNMGFCRVYDNPDDEDNKTTYLAHNDNGVLRPVDGAEIRNYIKDWLRKSLPTHRWIFKQINRTGDLNDSAFENLPIVQYNTRTGTRHVQHFHFSNTIWQVTKDKITTVRSSRDSNIVWRKNVIKHNVSITEDYFTITKEDNQYRIQLAADVPVILRFLELTSMMNWNDGTGKRKEKFTHEETIEHQGHLVNKIYTIGYLLHRFKDVSRSWLVYAMDAAMTDENKSIGRSGKSLLLKQLNCMMPIVEVNGRDHGLTKNNFLLGNITRETGLFLVDDAGKYIDFDFFYNMITSGWTINPKNKAAYTLDYNTAPKLAMTSNFSRFNDESTQARMIYMLFSDYFHEGGPGKTFSTKWQPVDEFGINLSTEYTPQEWNRAFNFFAQCVKFYLGTVEKINPPFDRIEARMFVREMSQEFKDWADVYFANPHNLNIEISRKELFAEYATEDKKASQRDFMRKLKAWAMFNKYTLNPREMVNDSAQGRILRSIDSKTIEMVYISTGSNNIAATNTTTVTNDEDVF